ncbi:murein transglycosylase [Fusarium austroafricanum]|uniref:glucan endo-1,3-beta-D-glucosidase n=1 Tax=Fusarium austroafricanum TaxID=2364996 RepID=A0A8H4KDH8_9HYPO|nr:murein transglycosylase [Fusarium austroafricanum]
MQNYHGDPYEREPLDSQNYYDSSPRRPNPPPHSYSPSAAHFDTPQRSNHPSAHPDSAYSRVQGGYDDHSSHGRSVSPSPYSGSAGYHTPRRPSPQHPDQGYYAPQGHNNNYGGGGGGHLGYDHPNSHTTPGADNFGMSASGGMTGLAVNVADRNPRYSGIGAMEQSSLPPPPSRAQQNPYGGHGGSNGYDSPRGSDPYVDNPYGGYRNSRSGSDNLGVVNPNEIIDDGDDGLEYGKSQRTSMLSLSNSDRAKRGASATAAAVGGGAAAGGLMSGKGGGAYEMNTQEKGYPYGSADKDRGMSKRCRWLIILLVCLVIIGAIVGGVVGSMVNSGKINEDKDKKGSSGESASEDTKKNGDLGKNSAEIKDLLNNADLHRVFPGMDYTPLNSQYPDCMHNPPSQNNITRDVAVLSQLTNKIRLYGTDCNQTQMLIHAIDRLELKDTKIWMGVWLDKNETTNNRQMDQMWDILDKYGADPFEGIIIANEILFRKEMTITSLAKVLDDTRSKLSKKGIKLPVATSDLGDDWTSELASDSDYIMANIHPFFAGVTAEQAADWTSSFWKNNNGQFWKTDKKKNIISETGWPSGGGTNCGSATSCTKGSVAGIDEMNTFMDGWVCQALKNGTNYFWFEAFDEPWKVRYNEKGKNWEDKWGLLTSDRVLKKGVKIPDCGGKTISDYSAFSS